MPIYSNSSIFPIDMFKRLDNKKFCSKKDIDKLFEFLNKESTYSYYLKLIRRFKGQHLFDVIVMKSLRRVFDLNQKPIKKDNIKSKSILDYNKFKLLANLKIDLVTIEMEVDKLIENNLLIEKDLFIDEIIHFTYKYLFVKSASLISCHAIGNLNVAMDFKHQHNKYLKHKRDIKILNYNEDNFYTKTNYVAAYEKSFKTEGKELMNKTISEILIYSNDKSCEKKLNNIIEQYIDIDKSLSATLKNRNLRIFYKHITCNFFSRELINFDTNDPELVEKFKKFKIKMR